MNGKTRKLAAPVLAENMIAIREELARLKTMYDAYSKELLATLQKEGRKSEGPFKRIPKRTLQITDEKLALEWASQHNVMAIDKVKAMVVIKRDLAVPPGFEVKETEYLSSAGSKKEE